MNFHLTVIEAFLDFKKGDLIKDPKQVEKYADSEWQGHVVKTPIPEVAAKTK